MNARLFARALFRHGHYTPQRASDLSPEAATRRERNSNTTLSEKEHSMALAHSFTLFQCTHSSLISQEVLKHQSVSGACFGRPVAVWSVCASNVDCASVKDATCCCHTHSDDAFLTCRRLALPCQPNPPHSPPRQKDWAGNLSAKTTSSHPFVRDFMCAKRKKKVSAPLRDQLLTFDVATGKQ